MLIAAGCAPDAVPRPLPRRPSMRGAAARAGGTAPRFPV